MLWGWLGLKERVGTNKNQSAPGAREVDVLFTGIQIVVEIIVFYQINKRSGLFQINP